MPRSIFDGMDPFRVVREEAHHMHGMEEKEQDGRRSPSAAMGSNMGWRAPSMCITARSLGSTVGRVYRTGCCLRPHLSSPLPPKLGISEKLVISEAGISQSHPAVRAKTHTQGSDLTPGVCRVKRPPGAAPAPGAPRGPACGGSGGECAEGPQRYTASAPFPTACGDTETPPFPPCDLHAHQTPNK